jgi:ABC-type multidrug transport system fused ATPase/permease subunit
MMLALLFALGLFVVGAVFLVVGADWFVDGARDLARDFGVSALVVGVLLAGLTFQLSLMSMAKAGSLFTFFQGFGDASVQHIHLLKQQSSQIRDPFFPATSIDFRRTEIAASGLQPGVRRKPGGRFYVHIKAGVCLNGEAGGHV